MSRVSWEASEVVDLVSEWLLNVGIFVTELVVFPVHVELSPSPCVHVPVAAGEVPAVPGVPFPRVLLFELIFDGALLPISI